MCESRGAYLGTFSQVHLTPRENFKKHVMVFLVCGLVMMTIIIVITIIIVVIAA